MRTPMARLLARVPERVWSRPRTMGDGRPPRRGGPLRRLPRGRLQRGPPRGRRHRRLLCGRDRGGRCPCVYRARGRRCPHGATSVPMPRSRFRSSRPTTPGNAGRHAARRSELGRLMRMGSARDPCRLRHSLERRPNGIPYVCVPGTQPKVSITFYYGSESDPGPYPIPADDRRGWFPLDRRPARTGARCRQPDPLRGL